MCGITGACGGTPRAATQGPAIHAHGGHGKGHGKAGNPGTATHQHTQAGAGAAQLGEVYGAWGSDAKFATVGSSTGQHHGSTHEKVVLQRVGADDSDRARRVFQAAMSMFDGIRVDQTRAPKDEPNSDHRVVTDELKAQWRQQFPGLPVPNRVIFDLKSGRATGLLFVGGEKAPDLGMGTLHQHGAGGAIMQHIWFTPGDMQLAFSDTTRKAEAIAAAKAR